MIDGRRRRPTEEARGIDGADAKPYRASVVPGSPHG